MSDEPIKLTPKQEAFCQAYIETGRGAEAYRRAYNAKRMADKTVWEKASVLLKKDKVAARVRQLAAHHAKRHDITVDSLTEMLRDTYELAKKVEAPSAAVAAINSLGKLHGLIVERKQVKGEHHHEHNHEHRSVSETADWLAGVLGNGSDRSSEKSLPN